jgi:hypothetical protein
MNREGRRRGLFLGTLLGFAWRGWGNTRKTPQSVQSLSRPRVETATSQIQVRRFTSWANSRGNMDPAQTGCEDGNSIELKTTTVFWDITRCSPFKVSRRFGGTYRLHLLAFTLVFCSLILRPWRWRRYIPPKRRLTFNGLHCIISQKIGLFINTAVRTSNPELNLLWIVSGVSTTGAELSGFCCHKVTLFLLASTWPRAAVGIHIRGWKPPPSCFLFCRQSLWT